MRAKIVIATVIAGACAWAGVRAQQAETPSAAPQFRASVDLVTTDVIPRDDNEQFVADLTIDDFEVYEDDVKQEIASVVLVHGGRVFNQVVPERVVPVQEGIILPPTRPTTDAAGRVFAIVLDDLHMQFGDTSRIRQLIKRIKENLIHEGDLFGIVSTGQSSIEIQATYDRNRLDEVANKVTGGALRPSEVINSVDSSRGPTELRFRAHVAFKTVYELLANLEKVSNRRKAIIYISNGYDFNPFAAARQGLASGSPFLSRFNERDFTGLQEGDRDIGNPAGRVNTVNFNDPNINAREFADADLSLELAEIVRAANRANATLYTIDPRGLMAGQDLDEEVDPASWNRHLMQTQTSMRILAEETGGFAVVNTNSFDPALRRMDNETSDYYVLGYYSSNPDPTRRDRQIEVRINRPDLDVYFRTSYSLPLPPLPESR